jgi:hypothetical protein
MVIDNSSNTNVVPDGTITSGTTTKSISIQGDTFTVQRTIYTYDLYAVSEAGEELDTSEATSDQKSVQIKGFTSIEFSVNGVPGDGYNNIVAGDNTYNGIYVPYDSYEIDLQAPSGKYPAVNPPINGTALTITDSTQNTGGTTGKLKVVLYSMTAGTYPAIYTDDGQRYIYVKNENGTQTDKISVEEIL